MDSNVLVVFGAFFLMVLFISSAVRGTKSNQDAIQDAAQQTLNLVIGLIVVAVIVGILLASGTIKY